MSVSVIILVSDRIVEVETTLQYLFKQINVFEEIIIVKNGVGNIIEFEEKFSQEKLTAMYPGLSIKKCLSNKNIGIGGWNLGAEIASKKYLLFLDDDSHPEIEFANNLNSYLFNEKDFKVIACRVNSVEGASNLMLHTSKDMSIIKTFCGAGVIIEANLFKKLNGFWSGIFVYAHELEFCIRTYDVGCKVYYADNLPVYHRGLPRESEFKYYQTSLSLNKIYFRYLPLVISIPYMTLKMIIDISNHDKKYWRAHVNAYLDSIKCYLKGEIQTYKINNNTIRKIFFTKGKNFS